MSEHRLKSVPAHPQAEPLRLAILDLIKTMAPDIPPQEIVALLSHLLGQVIAHLDQRQWTPRAAMKIVEVNLQAGNAQVLADLDARANGTKQ